MQELVARLQALAPSIRSVGGAALTGAMSLLLLFPAARAASQETVNPQPQAQSQSKGLSMEQLTRLLKEDPAPRVEYLVNKYGIGFYFTPETESELRDAGATPELLELIRKLAPQKPVEVKPPPPAPPTLVVNAKPGDAEVYVDDERRGQTGADGILKFGDLAAGPHKLRVSYAGYRSFEVNVELTAGQTNTVVAELQPIPPPAPVKEEAPAKEEAKPAPATEQKPPGNPDDPLTPHAPGIYFFEQASASANHLVELEEAPPAQRSAQAGRSALGAFGGFSRVKWKSLIFGSKAHLRVPAGRPLFYFYFPTVEADTSIFGLSNDAFRHTSTPNGFVLVHLQSQKSTREIPAKGSSTATVEEKDTVPFDYEKIAAGIYKVQLKSDLGPGEYGFLYGGVMEMMAQTWLFDFGIDKSK
ncbi:MAG TPA: PEGA domain-containing protein [Terracidiphilus sp.]|nr:PEGA domain-containing protein [Terracidiphilus sp.]